ncbi:MAG: DUF4388 domain-containing protein [Candidatus Obscuribacterales bacterium]|nr:DUF4388 domain-containing protein [Candidatus Obscuribacterales bacterium]
MIRRLDGRPSKNDLQALATAAKGQPGEKCSCSWQANDNEFILSLIFADLPSETYEWRLFSGLGSSLLPRWFHLSSDVELVYSMLMHELGETTSNPSAPPTDQLRTFTKLPRMTDESPKPEVARAAQASAPKPVTEETYAAWDSPTPTLDNVPIYSPSSALSPHQQQLYGNLALVNTPTLLQSISLGQLTGRLRIRRQWSSVDIFFENGTPVHAEGTHSTGDECFLQTICWKDGDFHFEPKIRTDEKTITQGLNSLMLQGAQLLDNTEFLKKRGLSTSTVLVRTQPNLSEQEFEQALLKGAPLDMQLLKGLYLRIDGRCSLQEIIDKLGFQRSQWVNLVSTLILCDVVNFAQASKEKKQLKVEPKALDASLIPQVKGMLKNEQTNLYTFPALLFFADQQIRFSPNCALSLVLFEVGQGRKKSSELKPSSIVTLGMHIKNIFNGILAEYENRTLALLLPDTKAVDAAKDADSFLVSLLSATLGPGLETTNLSLAIGIASYPDDAADLPVLLSAAETAVQRSRAKLCAVTLARDVVSAQ